MNRSFRRRSLRVAAFAVLGLAASSFAQDSAKQTPFVQTLMANWPTFDADHDGTITPAEIDTLLKNPAIKGDAAAAVSSLKLVTRGDKTKKLPPLTADFFKAYNEKAVGVVAKETKGDVVDALTATEGGGRDASGNQTPTTKPIDSPAKWDKYFVAGRKRLAEAGGTQWSTSSFTIDAMKQGALGDCFFVASLGSLARHRPEQLHSLVKQLPDGTFEATFPNAEPIKVNKLTDSQIAIAGTSGEGAFLAVFEQAYGKYRSKTKGGSTDIEGTDALYTGGDSSVTLRHLTGRETKRISFGKTLEKRAANAEKLLPEVRNLLVSNIQARLAITAGGVVGEKTEAAAKAKDVAITPPAILKNHVYVVTDYDAATDAVTIWNPHSNTFTPKGEPGLKNGYVTRKGKFTLPLTEAYQFFGSFTFETDQPAKKPATTKPADAAT